MPLSFETNPLSPISTGRKINEVLSNAFKDPIRLVKSLFSEEEAEAIAKEAIKNLERNGHLEEVKEFLNNHAFVYFNEEIDGWKFAEYLEETIPGVRFNDNILYYNDEPVAYIGKSIVPIKGMKKTLKELLLKFEEARSELEANEAYYFGFERGGKDLAESFETAYYFGRFWKSIEGKNDDLISRALKDLDAMPEWDPLDEMETEKIDKEIRKNDIALKILDFLPSVNVAKEKKLGLFTKYHVSLPLSYEELFYNHLGEYSRSEIHSALRELENTLTAENKEKVKALRNLYEEKEGIRRRKKATVAIVGILLAGAAAGALSYSFFSREQDKQPPTIELVESRQDKNFTATFNVHDKSGVSNVYALIDFPSGKQQNITLHRTGNFSILSFPLKEEGKYSIKLYAKDIKGNVGTFEMACAFFDKPTIESVKYEVKPPNVELNVTASDTTGIKKVLIEAFGKNYYVEPLSIDEKGNGVYSGKIPLQMPSDKVVEYKIYAIDPFNNTSVESGKVTLTPRQQFLTWVSNNGYDLDIVSPFWEKEMIKELFTKERFDELKHILNFAQANATAPPKNLAYLVVDQLEKDERIKDWEKVSFAAKALSNLEKLGIHSLNRMDSVWLANNATIYDFENLEGLKKALNFSENTSISLNYENVRCHSALADTGYYFDKIFKYPYETYYLALQVGDIFYYLTTHGGALAHEIYKIRGKDYVWNNLIIPYAEWRFKKIESGKFKPLDYKLTQGELKKLAEWADPKVVEAAARSLYPFDELMDHDLLGFDYHRVFHDFGLSGSMELGRKALERGVNNMKYNATLGASPFEYIYNLMMNDIKTKNERYQRVMEEWSAVPRTPWPNSWQEWKNVVENYYLQKDPEAILVKGYPIALAVKGSPVNPHHLHSGQADPFLSKIIGAMLDRPIVVLQAPYPRGPHPGVHDEPFVVGYDGKLIGFWYNLDKFLDDYDPAKNSYYIDGYPPAEPYIILYLVSDVPDSRMRKQFDKEYLNKVLNS